MRLLLTLCFIPLLCFASPFSEQDKTELTQHFLANITQQGAVMASPSHAHPDYYYHWTRDAAISMDLIEQWYEKNHDSELKERLFHYVSFTETSWKLRANEGYDILGEPKFYLDGAVYDKPWGRPQNDGAALVALTLSHFANELLKNNEHDYVREHLYSNTLVPEQMGLIKKALEYTAHHWQEKHFDLWEETYGFHFFSSVVQRQALIEGAALAHQLQDNAAGDYYQQQANQLSQQLLQHIDIEHQTILASVDATGPEKPQQLDSATLLATFYLKDNDPLKTLIRPYINNTANALNAYFAAEYAINKHHDTPLFGRYPKDTYDGYVTGSLGNPWVILTTVIARFYYQQALSAENPKNKQQLLAKGDAYLSRLKAVLPDNHLSEQLNRDEGNSQGARDLTWSYQALLTALDSRKQVVSEEDNGVSYLLR